MDTDLLKFIIALIIIIPMVVFGMAVMQQKTVKTTCGIDVSLSDALFYNTTMGSCPTVTIKGANK